MRRIIALARDWSHRRKAWGKSISDLPLQREVLKQMVGFILYQFIYLTHRKYLLEEV